jgi:hypothetical protein
VPSRGTPTTGAVIGLLMFALGARRLRTRRAA